VIVCVIFVIEYSQHSNAKDRILEMLVPLTPHTLVTEYVYHNPDNVDNDPNYEWRFDTYFEIGNRKIAVEVDGWKGHWSTKNRQQTKENIAKRDFKIKYLRTQGIELYAFPVKDLVGKKKLPTELFLQEMKLLQ
jgi:hypothetical protein